jgi:peptide/nickel transport system substrate-binding protein
MPTFRHRHALTMVCCVLCSALAAACGSSSGPGPAPTPKSSANATVRFALPPGEAPNYIDPFVSGPDSNNQDLFQFENLMYRPLYWFGNNGQPAINYPQSLALPPQFSNGGRTVTITMKHWRWSDGKPVTNRDVEFWMNLYMAEKGSYVGYVPGAIPDNIKSMSFPSKTPYSFSLTFKTAYSKLYLLYSNLSTVFAIPQHVWDKTGASSPVGNSDKSTAGAKKVWTFLNGQAHDQGSYATNPMWKVVDGPWKLSAFSAATGACTFVPNKNYSGPDKAHIGHFVETPFTSDTAEFDALRSGSIDYGYLPSEDLSQQAYFTSHGYTITKWPAFGFNDFLLNFNYPGAVGPILSQLYVRQAMQSLIDQSFFVKAVWNGAAFPTYGPVPIQPKNQYINSADLSNPYPYSPSKAKSLLVSHGWSIHPGGADTCTRPGSGPSQCGPGVPAGAKMDFTELLASGSAPFTTQAEAIQSAWGKVGIQVKFHVVSEAAIFSAITPCTKGKSCGWQIANFGEPGGTPTYSPQYLPTGALWFQTGAVDNPGGFSSATIDKMERETYTDSSPALVGRLSQTIGKALPVLWQPNYYYQVSVISNKLHGVTPEDPDLNIYPQNWTVSP